jgi:hypothetical protein
MPSFGTLGQLLFAQIWHSAGGRGGSRIFFIWESYYFWSPITTTYGVLNNGIKKKKDKKKKRGCVGWEAGLKENKANSVFKLNFT